MAAMELHSEHFSELLGGETPVLIDFYAPWCSYCRRIGPAYDKLAAQYEGRVTLAKINVDEEPRLSEQEEIEVLPTMVLYRGGKAIGSIVAPESKAMIESFLEKTLAK